jgi:hypothetical protein
MPPPSIPLPPSSLSGVTFTLSSDTQTIPVNQLHLGENQVPITNTNIISTLDALPRGSSVNPSVNFSYAGGAYLISDTISYTPPLRLVTSGLILNYNIGNTLSYPGTGTTITDLQENSNATTVNNPTYTSSGGGSLTFNGTNQYFITNTSLVPNLLSTTSTTISVFLWVYPMGEGVILTELGLSSINAPWSNSQIAFVSGKFRFTDWDWRSVTANRSSPLNAWYYVGFTHDGNTGYTTAYVNGEVAVIQFYRPRRAPNQYNSGLYYSVALARDTNLGAISYGNIRFGGMQVYNIALNDDDVLTNYNAQKSRFGLS